MRIAIIKYLFKNKQTMDDKLTDLLLKKWKWWHPCCLPSFEKEVRVSYCSCAHWKKRKRMHKEWEIKQGCVCVWEREKRRRKKINSFTFLAKAERKHTRAKKMQKITKNLRRHTRSRKIKWIRETRPMPCFWDETKRKYPFPFQCKVTCGNTRAITVSAGETTLKEHDWQVPGNVSKGESNAVEEAIFARLFLSNIPYQSGSEYKSMSVEQVE